MKIGLITELFHPHVGGIESRFLGWARTFTRGGSQVNVLCVNADAGHDEHEQFEGISIRRVVRSDRYTRASPLKRDWACVVRYTLAVFRHRHALSDMDAVIFSKWPVLPVFLVAPFLRAPILLDWCEFRSGPVWQLIYAALTRMRCHHICIHQGIADKLISRFGVPAHRITVIGSGVPLTVNDAIAMPRQTGKIVFIGRLEAHKRPGLLLETFLGSGLAEHGNELHFIGTGSEMQTLVKRADGAGNVFFHGNLTNRQRDRVLKNAALLVLLSTREGFPVVIAEAAMFGVPVLTTQSVDNGGADVLNQYQCGWVCPTDDRETLARALQTCSAVESADWQEKSARCSALATSEFSLEHQTRLLTRTIKGRSDFSAMTP